MEWCDECGSWEYAGDMWESITIYGYLLLCSWCLDEYIQKGWAL